MRVVFAAFRAVKGLIGVVNTLGTDVLRHSAAFHALELRRLVARQQANKLFLRRAHCTAHNRDDAFRRRSEIILVE